jgi:hypothetical protein
VLGYLWNCATFKRQKTTAQRSALALPRNCEARYAFNYKGRTSCKLLLSLEFSWLFVSLSIIPRVRAHVRNHLRFGDASLEL